MTTASSPTPGATKTALGVHSEVGKLRKVMVHRPDLELKRLTPENHDDLLFDDVLWVKRARQQHDQFADLLRDRGTEVVYLEELLAETLDEPGGTDLGPRPGRHLVHRRRGDRRRGARLPRAGRRHDARRPPDRRPDGQRGAGAARRQDRGGRRQRRRRAREAVARRLGDGARRLRPPAAAQQLLHPRPIRLDLRRRRRQPDVLAGPPPRGPQRRGDLPLPPRLRRAGLRSSGTRGEQEGESFGRASSEGGDIMPIGNRTVAIGMSERTTSQMIEKIADQPVQGRRRRPGHRGGHDPRPGPHAPRHGLHVPRPRRRDALPEGRPTITAYSVRPGDNDGELDVTARRARSSAPSRTRSSQGAAGHRDRRRRLAGRARAMGRRQQRRRAGARRRRRLRAQRVHEHPDAQGRASRSSRSTAPRSARAAAAATA